MGVSIRFNIDKGGVWEEVDMVLNGTRRREVGGFAKNVREVTEDKGNLWGCNEDEDSFRFAC